MWMQGKDDGWLDVAFAEPKLSGDPMVSEWSLPHLLLCLGRGLCKEEASGPTRKHDEPFLRHALLTCPCKPLKNDLMIPGKGLKMMESKMEYELEKENPLLLFSGM